MSDEILERRYRTLMRAYPASYRKERGDELLDTLMTSDAGRRWPSPRQIAGLVRGGILVRAGGAAENPAAAIRWQGLQLTGVAVLAYGAAHATADVWPLWAHDRQVSWRLPDTVTAGLMLIALLAITLGWTRSALGFASLAVVTPMVVTPGTVLDQTMSAVWWSAAVAAAVIAAGVRQPAGVPPLSPTARILTAGPLVGVVLAAPYGLVPLYDRITTSGPKAVIIGGALVGLGALLLLGSADPRLPMIAAGLVTVKTLLDIRNTVANASVAGTPPSWESLQYLLAYTVVLAVLLGAMIAQRRRLARI